MSQSVEKEYEKLENSEGQKFFEILHKKYSNQNNMLTNN